MKSFFVQFLPSSIEFPLVIFKWRCFSNLEVTECLIFEKALSQTILYQNENVGLGWSPISECTWCCNQGVNKVSNAFQQWDRPFMSKSNKCWLFCILDSLFEKLQAISIIQGACSWVGVTPNKSSWLLSSSTHMPISLKLAFKGVRPYLKLFSSGKCIHVLALASIFSKTTIYITKLIFYFIITDIALPIHFFQHLRQMPNLNL